MAIMLNGTRMKKKREKMMFRGKITGKQIEKTLKKIDKWHVDTIVKAMHETLDYLRVAELEDYDFKNMSDKECKAVWNYVKRTLGRAIRLHLADYKRQERQRELEFIEWKNSLPWHRER